jgi:hypothetical protein
LNSNSEAFARMAEHVVLGMDKPDRVVKGVMRCGNCDKPLRLGGGGAPACKNAECVRNRLKKRIFEPKQAGL